MTDSPSPPDPDATPAAAARLKRRRRLWLIVGGIGLFFATIFGVIVYSDAPAPDLSDLAFEPITVPDEENLYLVLTKRGAELITTPILKDDEPPPPSVVLASGKTWRETLQLGETWTSEILARCSPAWDALANDVTDALTRYPIMQGTICTPTSATTPVLILRELTQNLRLAARARQYAGRPQDAARTALDGYEIGLRLADARGSQLDYIIGLGTQRDFVAILHELAAQPEAELATLDLISEGLRARRRDRDGYAHSLRNEIHEMAATLREVTPEQAESWASGPFRMHIGPVEWIAHTRMLFPLVYKPNLTVGLHADFIRDHLAWLDTPQNLRPKPAPEEFQAEIEISDLRQPYNLLGRFLTETYQAQRYTTQSRDKTFARRRLLEIHVALRRFHRDHGELPATLSDLVPAYLDAVPADPADGAPLRYSREFRAIWSGLDSFTMRSADEHTREGDLVLRLDFAAPLSPPPAAVAPE